MCKSDWGAVGFCCNMRWNVHATLWIAAIILVFSDVTLI